MSSKPTSDREKRLHEARVDSNVESFSEPPAKRQVRNKSPEPAPAPAPAFSIFGGGPVQDGRARNRAVGPIPASEPEEQRRPDTAVEVPEMAVDRLFSERIVTVLVGASQTTWRLHENLLSSSSDFFRSAFHSGFKEAREDRLLLPEDDPAAFELFVRWLYARALAASPPPGPAQQTQASLFHASSSSIQTWLRLYALTCKLMVEELENICVGAAWRYYSIGTRRPAIRDVQFIYENTPPGSGMRRLLRERLTLGMFRGRQNNPVTPEWREVLNETPDLGFDIVSEISGFHWISGGNAPGRAGAEECVFHRHEKGESCRPG